MTYFFFIVNASLYSLMVKAGQTKKSPFKMEFHSEMQSQCGICDHGWFKISERQKKTIQNGILH